MFGPKPSLEQQTKIATIVKAEPGSITFRVAEDKQPEPLQTSFGAPVSLPEALAKIAVVEKAAGSKFSVLCHSLPDPVNVTRAGYSNGFVGGALDSYNKHTPFCFRPDDVWAAIMAGLGRYVEANAEAFRPFFVAHEDKKKLEVIVDKPFTNPASVVSAVTQMQQLLANNIKDSSFRDWAMPKFTTTTSADSVVYGAMLMNSLKAYFKYGFGLLCGHPSITLLGTPEDWRELAVRVERLRTFQVPDKTDMAKWADILAPICQRFIATAEGSPSHLFWAKMTSYYRGSGGATLDGWLTAFVCINRKGVYQHKYDHHEWFIIDFEEIPTGVVCIPIEVDDNGHEYQATLVAGSFTVEPHESELCAKPRLDWIFLKNEQQQQPKAIQGDDSAMTGIENYGQIPVSQ